MKRKLEKEDKDQRVAAIHADLQTCLVAVRSGEYAAMARTDESLRHAQQRRLALADKQRKLQIKNINELFEFDCRAIQSQYLESRDTGACFCIDMSTVLSGCV